MKTYRINYSGNSTRGKRHAESNIIITADSERAAVEQFYSDFYDDNYFPQDDGSIKDCDGVEILTCIEGDASICYDGGFFTAELVEEK